MQIRLDYSLLCLPFLVCAMFLEGSLLAKRPNVIFVLADDLGWAELGCYGNRFNETPNLDRLARQGVNFSNAHCSAPGCSPSRNSLQYGVEPFHS